MKHVVCYSGGHSSAIVAIEVVRKFGKDNVILLNHDISETVEGKDIKRFKSEVAGYLGLPITYANYKNLSVEKLPDQFDVCVAASAFKVGNGTELCTSRLKTEPFMKWLEENVPDKDCIIYYGFDKKETSRIQRRSGILGEKGYKTDYPLALWENRTIFETSEIGIIRPNTYESFRHANCVGCLKGGKLHWYIVYCYRRNLFEKAKQAEDAVGYTIMASDSMEELEPVFAKMWAAGIVGSEHEDGRTFWARVKRSGILLEQDENDNRPCECIF